MLRFVLAALLVAGCGRVGFDPRDSGGANDTGATTDSGEPGLQCTTEDFAGGLPATWNTWSAAAGFSAAVVNAGLEIQLPASSDGYAGASTTVAVDLTGVRLTVEVPAVVGPSNAETYLAIFVDMPNLYAMFYDTGRLELMRRGGGDVVDSVAYDATEHRHWRIQHSRELNQIVYSTSANRNDWNVQAMHAATVPLTSVQFELAAGTYLGGLASPGVPRFDNVELCTPL